MSPNKHTYILDSYALLAFLNGEPGEIRVKDLLDICRQGNCRILMCTINLGEVLYLVERRLGLSMAQQVLALVNSLPLEMIDASRLLVLEAAHLKAHYPISYADAFVGASAIRENGIVLTGDPEFESIKSIVNIEWLE